MGKDKVLSQKRLEVFKTSFTSYCETNSGSTRPIASFNDGIQEKEIYGVGSTLGFFKSSTDSGIFKRHISEK